MTKLTTKNKICLKCTSSIFSNYKNANYYLQYHINFAEYISIYVQIHLKVKTYTDACTIYTFRAT